MWGEESGSSVPIKLTARVRISPEAVFFPAIQSGRWQDDNKQVRTNASVYYHFTIVPIVLKYY